MLKVFHGEINGVLMWPTPNSLQTETYHLNWVNLPLRDS